MPTIYTLLILVVTKNSNSSSNDHDDKTNYHNSRFHHGVNKICPFLEFYAAGNGSFLPPFQNNILIPSSKVQQSKKTAWGFPFDCQTLEDGIDRLSQNVGKKLPFWAM
jgi:hypothetical protein